MTKIITKTLKNESVYVRLDPIEKKAMLAAAKRDGLSLSAWIRLIALNAVKRSNNHERH